MRRVLERLLGGKSANLGQSRAERPSKLHSELAGHYDANNENDRLGLALLVILRRQLDILGFSVSEVPAVEPYISRKSRGALAGMAIGVLEAEGLPVTKDRLIDASIATFGLVFGEQVGRELAMHTANEILQEDEVVLAASEWSRLDIRGVYESGGTTTAAGFYLASQDMI